MEALPSVRSPRPDASFGVTRVEVRGFRSARDVAFSPGPLCALVGEASAGKSSLLAAVRAVLDPAGAPLTSSDLTKDGGGEVSITLRLEDGSTAVLAGSPEENAVRGARDHRRSSSWPPRREPALCLSPGRRGETSA